MTAITSNEVAIKEEIAKKPSSLEAKSVQLEKEQWDDVKALSVLTGRTQVGIIRLALESYLPVLAQGQGYELKYTK